MNPPLPSLRLPGASAAASAAAIIGGALGLGQSPAAAPHAVTPSATMVLASDVLPGLAGLSSTPTDPSTAVQVGITLASRDPAGQDAAYRAIYTPGSPQFHHFLNTTQVAQLFGARQASFDAVKAYATRDGMKLAFTPDTHSYLLLSGTAAQAERTFSVTFRDFTRNGQHFYANTQGPTVPANADVTGVIGLNSLLRSHTYSHGPSRSVKPAQGTCTATCVGLTTPQDLWSIYGQDTNLSDATKNFGQGQSLGVLGEGAWSGPLADLRAFEKEFSLPQIPVNIHSVNDDFQDNSGAGEWDIDMQASSGMAPKATSMTLYFGKDLSDAAVLGLFQAFQSDANGPKQANASFGECETDPTSPATGGGAATPVGGAAGTAGIMFTAGSEDAFQKATLSGKTLFSSTGDTGSSCPVVFAAVVGAGNGVLNQAYPETNYPASSRYVTSVGGTVLDSNPNTATPAPASNATRSVETAWTHGGGGNTLYIPEPAYQQGIPLLDSFNCISQPSGTPYSTPTPCRGIPDVAAQSGDIATNGYAVTMSGANDSQGGGTSLSSPLWMGMWARIQAAAPINTSGQYTNGFANPALYAVGLNATKDAADFFDVGNGTSTSPPTCNGVYCSAPRNAVLNANTGWDYTTGLGAPNVLLLCKDITGSTGCAVSNTSAVVGLRQDCGQLGLAPCGFDCSTALWTNPSHHATDVIGNTDDQLTLLKGQMSTSPDGKTLHTFLTVANLTETVPTGAAAAEWYFLWTYKGIQYFTNAELSALPGSTPTFHDGQVVPTGPSHKYTNSSNTNTTGKFVDGPNGVIEVDVPLANVGSPPIGTSLASPVGETYLRIGAPTVGPVPGAGSLQPVDTGGPQCPYTLGSGPQIVPVSSNTGTTSGNNGKNLGTPNGGFPFPVIWPGIALAAAGLVMLIASRRRRSRSSTAPLSTP